MPVSGSLAYSLLLIRDDPMKPDFEVVDYDITKKDYRSVANYDESRYVGSSNEYRTQVTRNAYNKLIGSLEGKQILDVGCGTGRGLTDFAGKASMAIGTDASQDMLIVAAQKVS